MSRTIEEKLSMGERFREERERLGLSRAQCAGALGKTPQAIGEYERGVSYPGGEVLTQFALIGADIQYIATGVRSKNLNAVAEEAGSYQVDPQGVGAVSREEQKIIEMYRRLRPSERTRLREIVDWLVSAKVKKDETGSG